MHPWEVDLHDTLSHALTSEPAWMTLAHHALTEAEVADQHEGRFLVELLQNVRDAWCMRERQGDAWSVLADRPAHAAMVVTDHGLLVADQGAGFDLDRPEVLQAVQYLRRSSKRGREEEAKGLVGHWGIGLKAILRRCQAFQVWSRIGGDDGAERQIGADFRRSRSWEVLSGLLQGADPIVRARVEAEVALMPLFRFPHPARQTIGEDDDVVDTLLGDASSDASAIASLIGGHRFRTVVRLDFKDEAWMDMLRARGGEDDRVKLPLLDPEDVWREVRRVDPRTVLLLGTIGTLDLIRLRRSDAGPVVTQHARLQVRPVGPRALLKPDSRPSHRCFAVGLESPGADGGATEWDVFAVPADPVVVGYSAAEQGPAEVAIAVPRSPPAQIEPDLPLFMFYPIRPPEAERGEGLPFLVHGPFFVKPDRTGFDPSRVGDARNAAVLTAAAELVVAAAVCLVGESSAAVWGLLPSPTPPEAPGLVAQFRRQVAQGLAAAPVLVTATGERVTPSARALVLSAGTSKDVERCVELAALFAEHVPSQVMTPAAVAALLDWVRDAWGGTIDRATPFLGASLPLGVFADALVAWSAAAVGAADAQMVRVPLSQGAAVADMVLAGFGDASFRRRVQDDTLPVIPCEDRDGHMALVRAAPSVRAAGRATNKPRVVFYRRSKGEVTEEDEEARTLPRPPAAVPIFNLDEGRGAGFREHGEALGLREHRGDPAVVEEVLRRALPAVAGTEPEIAGFLASLLHRMASRAAKRAEWLSWNPLGWVPDKGLWRVASGEDATQRADVERDALRWRGRLDALGVEVPSADGVGGARSLCFPASWFEALRVVLEPAGSGDIVGSSVVREALGAALAHHCAVDRTDALAAIDDPRWKPWLDAMDATIPTPDRVVALARLLLFLGVWATPRVEVAWLWPLSLGPVREVRSGIRDQTSGWDWLPSPTSAEEVAGYRGLLGEPVLDHHGEVHYAACEAGLARPDRDGFGARLLRQAWFPDCDVPGFVNALAPALEVGWLSRVLHTHWTCRCSGKGRRPSQWPGHKITPTFAALQARTRLRVPVTRPGQVDEAPLDAIILETAGQQITGVYRHAPIWSGSIGDLLLPAATREALRVPQTVEAMDGQQAAALLAWLRERAPNGTPLTAAAEGLLSRLVRQLLGPASASLAAGKGKWDPAVRAALHAALRRAGALPCLRAGELEWADVVPTERGLRLEAVEGDRVAALGARDAVTRYDRERLRDRDVLIGPDSSSTDPLPHRAEVLAAIGVEMIAGTPPPGLEYQDAPGADAEPYRMHLRERATVLLALLGEAGGDRFGERLEGVIAGLQCVSGLAEAGAPPAPIPSAFEPVGAGQPGRFLVDVDGASLDGPLGGLAWGVAGVFDRFDLLASFMAVLAAADEASLALVARALGIATVSGSGRRSGARRERLARLLGLSLGGGVESFAASLLAQPGWPGDPRATALGLAPSLQSPDVWERGRIDHAQLLAVVDLLARAPENGRVHLDAFLTAAHLRFVPSAPDQARRVLVAVRRLVAAAVFARDATIPSVLSALHATDLALAAASVRIRDLVLPGVPLIDALADTPIWASALPDADLVAALDQARVDLGPIPEIVGVLAEKRGEQDRRASAATHARASEDRRVVARAARWTSPPRSPATVPLLIATSLTPALRAPGAVGASASAGPSIEAVERGAVGEVLALGDVVARAIAEWLVRPDETAERVRVGLDLADGLRSASVRRGPVAPTAVKDLLARCASGDSEARDDLADRLDVTALRGPGFDVLDPFGPLGVPSGRSARVEVKTTSMPVVAGASVIFRLTVNEVYRSLQGDDPFVVRVYHDPGDGGLPTLQLEISDPASRIRALGSADGRDVLASVRGGGHVIVCVEVGEAGGGG